MATNQKEWTKMTRTYNFFQIGYGNLNLFHMHGQVASLGWSNHFFIFSFLSELGPSLTFLMKKELGWVGLQQSEIQAGSKPTRPN